MHNKTRTVAIVVLNLLSGLFAGLDSPPATAFDDTAIATVRYPAWFKQTFYNLGDDLAEAEQAGKRGVLVFFSTQGCSYCQLMLQETFAEPSLAERLRAEFDVIGLDMFDDAEIADARGETLPVKDFAVREGAQFSPTLLFYGSGGEPLLRLVGYYDPARLGSALDYLAERRAGGEGFRSWLEGRLARQPTRPAAGTDDTLELIDDPLFAAPPYQLDRSRAAAEHPLLVIFADRRCRDCPRLRREVLSDPEVRARLSGIELVRLDAEDQTTRVVTPDGSTTTPATWRADLGFTHLPAMAWFDRQGRQVLTTDALVLKGRFLNSLGYVRDRAYAKGWTYQRYARSENLRRLQNPVTP